MFPPNKVSAKGKPGEVKRKSPKKKGSQKASAHFKAIQSRLKGGSRRKFKINH